MSNAVVGIVVALPFASAVLLAAIASWRVGIWINVGTSGLQFIAAGALVWGSDTVVTRLAALTAFVALTTSWFGRRDIVASLGARLLDRRRPRLYHVSYQALVGGIQAAMLAERMILTWMALAVAVAAATAMTGAVRGEAAAAARSKLALYCGSGLMLALIGILLLDLTPGPAAFFLVVGYGALAGLVPLHAWLPAMSAASVAPGAIIVTLMANAPMVLFMSRLHAAPELLIAFGLVSLLPTAVALFARLEWRRTIALAGIAQLGLVVFAIGVGATQAALVLLALLTLARSAVQQSRGESILAWLALVLLPLCALYLLAGPTAATSAWLLLPVAVGSLMVVWALLDRRLAGPAGVIPSEALG